MRSSPDVAAVVADDLVFALLVVYDSRVDLVAVRHSRADLFAVHDSRDALLVVDDRSHLADSFAWLSQDCWLARYCSGHQFDL